MEPFEEEIQQKIQTPKQITKNQLKNSMIIVILILILIIGLLFGIYILDSKKNDSTFLRRGRLNVTPIPTRPNVNKQEIAKVGIETIYAEDLKIELAAYPIPNDPNAKKILLDKLVTDSVILQGAAADNIITLNEHVFNSPYKDYTKRISLVNEAKEKIEKKEVEISGTIISLWIFNTRASDLGYDKSKEIISAKANSIYNDVKNNKITLEQAGEEIKNDTSLKNIDPAYKVNAYISFHAKNNEAITFDPTFDAILRKLKVGELSPLYIARDREQISKQTRDAVYMFAVINKKNSQSLVNFEKWFEEKASVYAKKIY